MSLLSSLAVERPIQLQKVRAGAELSVRYEANCGVAAYDRPWPDLAP
jgi:hypothetical protein